MRTTRFEKDALVAEAALADPPATGAGGDQVNICGVLIHAAPGRVADVAARLDATPGCDVATTAEDGRIVVVVEDNAEASALARLKEFTAWDGVAASALVFHQFEDAAALHTEIEAWEIEA